MSCWSRVHTKHRPGARWPAHVHARITHTNAHTGGDARAGSNAPLLSHAATHQTGGEGSTLVCRRVLNPLYSSGFNSRASANTPSHAIRVHATMEAKLPVSKTDCRLTHNTYVKQTPPLYGSEVEGGDAEGTTAVKGAIFSSGTCCLIDFRPLRGPNVQRLKRI